MSTTKFMIDLVMLERCWTKNIWIGTNKLLVSDIKWKQQILIRLKWRWNSNEDIHNDHMPCVDVGQIRWRPNSLLFFNLDNFRVHHRHYLEALPLTISRNPAIPNDDRQTSVPSKGKLLVSRQTMNSTTKILILKGKTLGSDLLELNRRVQLVKTRQ